VLRTGDSSFLRTVKVAPQKNPRFLPVFHRHSPCFSKAATFFDPAAFSCPFSVDFA
jgi:hypothetical protein